MVIPCKPADGSTTFSASSAKVWLPRCLVRTLRLATGPGELASVLGFFFKALAWHFKGSPGEDQDASLRIQGVTHILGLGTGEILTPQEIYWKRCYDRLPDFIPRSGWIVFDVGANTGVWAIQQARRGAHVHAFEPNPDCLADCANPCVPPIWRTL
jgi:hypothetical protein